ncbi:MAG: hypothetical protein COT92_02650 [Candidatus Doudnabacteria bacterium CG10_big_fil_rev_8_21_14_0_10_42_18]|uniref:Uncharacterized protein n=1 Tax=Candidatus Doudnabacteria bacterium CG10_big_fil_rev_8_21_14_0_10_42_18 TaxID=1974552 RepID=A0A2H0VAK3_9BACT|nr:MAG: hypothetical protein COT92_02650 [Candidatus Doudnabacteria bacterium CG10_big_fil_rev_8_21_14_0_10_42_18]
MSNRVYSPEQLEALQKNPNVAKCGQKSITYVKDFKTRAVKAYYQESLSPNMIFVQAGFDLNIIGRDQPKECLRRWRAIYKTKGEKELSKERRERSKGHKAKFDESDPKYLKTKIAYLEAENDFLRNLKTKNKA